MTDLSLAEKVEGLAGPCRETDLALHIALYPDGEIARTVKRDWRGRGQVGVRSWDLTSNGVFCTETRDERGNVWASSSQHLPHLTGSLDAVVALIQKELPGWRWGAFIGTDRRGHAYLHPREFSLSDQRTAATPALALLAAFLRAKGEQNGNA